MGISTTGDRKKCPLIIKMNYPVSKILINLRYFYE